VLKTQICVTRPQFVKLQFQLDYITYKESEYANSVKVMCSKETLRSVKIPHVYSLFAHNKHIISEIMQRVTLKNHIENPTRSNSVSKFYFIFILSSTCFGRHTAHHQEPKTTLPASGFAYVEGCWTCGWWTLEV